MRKSVKKGLSALLALSLASVGIVMAAETETVINLSDSGITVDGNAISGTNTNAVYLSKNIETHGDVPAELAGLENKVITITDGGTYRFSGEISDAQIKVAADETDEVKIILDNASITCRTAPAILVYSAKELAEVGKSAVTIYIEDDSVNEVNGSHTVKTETVDVKYDAAISSAISLTIDGSGTLNVNSDNEGIEVKNKHLTINDGDIHIISCDDPINGSEDGVSHITINGGWIFCSSENGKEGDGIDSNGYVTINGGTLIALGNPNSMDGGLDSDMGTTINGGTVVAAGNMYDPIENDGDQLFMFLQFRDQTDDILCITDSENNPVFAYDFPFNYSYISFSSPELAEGTYHVSLGGEISGEVKDGLYTNITSYTGGTTMYHGGVTADGGNRGPGGFGGMQPPEGMEFPDGTKTPEPPEGMEFPEGMERPEGMGRPEGMERPMGGGRGPGGMQSSASVATADFEISRENSSYTNVTSNSELTYRFTDVPRDAWFYNSVERAAQQGWLKGVGDNMFAPENQLTGAEWITILARIAEQAADVGDTWYEAAVNWGTEKNIIHRSGWDFEENTPITREQMADMIMAFAEVMELDMTAAGDLTAFDDSENISDYANKAFTWAVGARVLQGDGTSLNPKSNLTRAEAAEVLIKLNALMNRPAEEDKVNVYPVSVASDLYTAFSGSTESYFPDGFQTGFGSGVTFKGYDADGNMQFYGVTDRGPSLDLTLADGSEAENTKVFPSPEFTPSIGIITIKDGQAVIEESITLKNADGEPLTGLPLPSGEVGATGETALDINMNELEYDSEGFDPEGIAVDSEGNFWLADEYGPFIAKFNANGVLQKMYTPGDGLPQILASRIANRGFEGITITPSGNIIASVQSVLDVNGETAKTSTFIRLVELNPETGETKMYAYPVALDEYSSPKNCKLGDIYALDNDTVLIVEQGKLADGSMRNIIYKVELANATDITDLEYNEKALEYASAEELASVIQYAEKEVYINLRDLNWTAEKAEGICITDKGDLAVMIEDDFGLAGAVQTAEGEPVTINLITEGDKAQMWIIRR